MEITVKKEDIVSALNTTLGVVEKRQTLPILANVLLEVEVIEGELECPETGRKFPISRGIPDMRLNEDE